jgi:osmotically-inducible protein OsmY
MYQMPLLHSGPGAIVEHMTQATQRNDQDLRANVTDELLYAPNLDAARVDVAVKDGVVTLSGDVGSLPERFAAKRATMSTWGVKTIADNLTVRSPGTPGTDDADMARTAKQLLDWAVDVPSSTVKVDVRDQTVTLSGNVTWDYQRDAAERAIMYIKGLTGVRNTISLSQGSSVPVVKAAVEKAIQRNAQLRTQTINVDVNGHELTLRGNVRSFADRREAEHAAWAAAGVTSVKNNLFVTA